MIDKILDFIHWCTIVWATVMTLMYALANINENCHADIIEIGFTKEFGTLLVFLICMVILLFALIYRRRTIKQMEEIAQRARSYILRYPPLYITHPEIAREWADIYNLDALSDVTFVTITPFYWHCSQCGRLWIASPWQRFCGEKCACQKDIIVKVNWLKEGF